MLTMSRSCNAASEQGSSSGWKESYRSTAESVESFEDSVDSDNSSSSSHASRSQSGSNLQPPIGCITTHSVSAVIRPEKKMPPIDPLQFVKIQKNELSKKAVEQIKLAEEVKITKEKIKEVEEEWQNNLMSWKSKRKLTKNNSEDESVLSRNTNRKTKTFSEILNEKARSGGRIGYNLHRYAQVDSEEEKGDGSSDRKAYRVYEAAQPMYDPSQLEDDAMTFDHYAASSSNSELSFDPTESNLNRLLKSNSAERHSEDEICRNGLGDVVVFDTTLLEEFSIKSDGCDVTQKMNGREAAAPVNRNDTFSAANSQRHCFNSPQSELAEQNYQSQFESNHVPPQSNENNHALSSSAAQGQSTLATSQQNPQLLSLHKVHVPIKEWKSSQGKSLKQPGPSSDDDVAPHNSSFEVEDEEDELDEELERLRLDQERSFKAKLYAFENLAKQEEEAARKAAETYRRRQQSRHAKLAAERSKSLGNIQQSSSSSSHHKAPVATSHSVPSSSVPVSQATFSPESAAPSQAKSQLEKQSKSLQNLNSSEYSLSGLPANSSNSTVYNFTDKTHRSQQDLDTLSVQSEPKSTQVKSQRSQQAVLPTSQQQNQAQNIYENITPIALSQQHQSSQSQPARSPIDPVPDSNAIRNASQKLLQQQQQIYQNQPLPTNYQPQAQPQQQQSSPQEQQHYSSEPFSGVPPSSAANFVYQFDPSPLDHPVQPTDTILNDQVINPVPIRGYSISDDVGLPPIQITKSNQSGPNNVPYNQTPLSMPTLAGANQEEEHMYVNQNQLMLNPQGKSHNPVYQYDYRPNSATYENFNPSIHYPEPNYENKTLIQKRMDDSVNGNIAIYPPEQFPPQAVYPNTPNQYLYYPKPYSASNAAVKPIVKQQPPPQMMPSDVPRAVPLSQNNAARFAPNGYSSQQQQPRVAYNQNHWLLQEAELRRQLDSIESSGTSWLKNSSGLQPPQPSVSGKKKCSSCMDELGKGCAAMVIESLSLFYHINCFRCSVCNVQLGNGTVGTDVRVRNNKLHCQNCYSNDEAGLKFSRV